ncbi:Hypothetical protein, putative [Bodo saltans]|uniref:Uncharacterized protein n=1 Tax=Bodo saltans TaxID=75058 RepID=A0A0S4IPJ0_BODSA|nr:Hypothetical protein, putative [Bodo saltans]|eukprot:CUF06715.1 Hypothetical protein, putative [Bodo saltans]
MSVAESQRRDSSACEPSHLSHLDSWIKAVRHLSCFPGNNAPRIRRSQPRVLFHLDGASQVPPRSTSSVLARSVSLSSVGGVTDDHNNASPLNATTTTTNASVTTTNGDASHHPQYASPLVPLPLSPLRISRLHHVPHTGRHSYDSPTASNPVTPPGKKTSVVSPNLTVTIPSSSSHTVSPQKVMCPFPACGAMIFPRELETHQRSVHAHRNNSSSSSASPNAQCTHCLTTVFAGSDKEKHESRCLEALVVCPLGCGKRFSRRDITGHLYTSWRTHDPALLERATKGGATTNAEDPMMVVCTLLRTLHDEERAAALRLTLASRAQQTLDWLRDNYPNHRSLLGTFQKTMAAPPVARLHVHQPGGAISPSASSLQPPTLDDIISDVGESSLQLEALDTPHAVPLHYLRGHHGAESQGGMSMTSDLHFEVVSGAPSFAFEDHRCSHARPLSCISRNSMLESGATSHVEFMTTQPGVSEAHGMSSDHIPSSYLRAAEVPPVYHQSSSAFRRRSTMSDSAGTIGFEEEHPPAPSNVPTTTTTTYVIDWLATFREQSEALLDSMIFHEGSVIHLMEVVKAKEDVDDGVIPMLEKNVEESFAQLSHRIGEWRRRFGIDGGSGGGVDNGEADDVTFFFLLTEVAAVVSTTEKLMKSHIAILQPVGGAASTPS